MSAEGMLASFCKQPQMAHKEITPSLISLFLRLFINQILLGPDLMYSLPLKCLVSDRSTIRC